MSALKLPVKFDEDFDLVDADGFPLLFGADMIDHSPEMGREIMKRVNSHDRLVEALREVLSMYPWSTRVEAKARLLLAELEPKS